jgi:hypothetical protein
MTKKVEGSAFAKAPARQLIESKAKLPFLVVSSFAFDVFDVQGCGFD